MDKLETSMEKENFMTTAKFHQMIVFKVKRNLESLTKVLDLNMWAIYFVKDS